MAAIRRRQASEPESYFVSMTDLMIGLLFIFIIMLMSFAINFRQAETDSRQAEAESEQRQRVLEDELDRLTDNRESLTYILESIEQSLKEQGIQVQIFPESGILRLPERILFDTGQAVLNPEGRNAVAALGRALEPILPCFANVELEDGLPQACPPQRHGRLEAVFIEGHTDNVPIASGRFASNWELSAARAIGTYNALIAALPAVAEVRNDAGAKLIGVSGYGEFRPVFEGSNETETGRRANRRIDLRFLMATPEPRERPR